MEIVKEDNQPTGLLFRPLASASIPQILARVNVFGMSNTAYRTDMLREIPSSPPQCRLMDSRTYRDSCLDSRRTVQLRQHTSDEIPAIWG